jgi:hypothetical protein
MRFLSFVQSSLWSMSDAIRALQEEIEGRAMLWTAATIDDDDEIEEFIEGIPGYITSGTSKSATHHRRRPHPFPATARAAPHDLHTRGLSQRQRARPPPPLNHMPRHHPLPHRRLLHLLLLQHVRLPDVVPQSTRSSATRTPSSRSTPSPRGRSPHARICTQSSRVGYRSQSRYSRPTSMLRSQSSSPRHGHRTVAPHYPRSQGATYSCYMAFSPAYCRSYV